MQTELELPDRGPTQPRRRRKWWPWIASGLLAITGIVLSIPTLLGSKWIYEPILERLANDKFDLSVDSVKLRWFSPIEFRGIAVRQNEPLDSEKVSPLITVNSLKSNRSLLGYLINGRNLGRIEVVDPKLDIALLEDGTNFQKLIRAFEGSNGNDTRIEPKPKAQPKLDLDIALRGLSVQIEPADGSPSMTVVPPFDVDVAYRALTEEPLLIVGPAQVLEHVALTQELVRLGLGMAIPLLSNSAWFDGSVSLKTQEIRIPLRQPMQSSGEAVLSLHQVRSGPSEPVIVGALDALAKLRNKELTHEIVFVDGSQVVLKLSDQRVFHSGLEAGLPKLDPRLQVATQGFVGLADRSLDLQLEIPIPVEQLARRETVQQIGVPRVKLPIGGTLDDPIVKWEVMRGESAALLALISNRLATEAPITSSIVDALGGVTEGNADQAIEAAVDFVRSLRERRGQANSTNQDILPDGANGTKDTENEPRRPLRDALRKAIRGK
ncbi:MAG: hypothetical protein ABL921_01500 [Pirellula sp.]